MREEKGMRDALKKIADLEVENAKLKTRNAVLRFNLLPKDEQTGALNVFNMNRDNPELFGPEVDTFKWEYINYKDENDDGLPF